MPEGGRVRRLSVILVIICGVVFTFSVANRGTVDSPGRSLGSGDLSQVAQTPTAVTGATNAITTVTPHEDSATPQRIATPSETPALSPTVETKPSAAIVQVDALNVRTGPSTSHPVVATAKKGESLIVTQTENDGAWLRVQTAAGIAGYVSSEFVVMGERRYTPVARIPAQTPASVPTYEILEVQDVSSSSAKRLQIRIRISKSATEAQLRLICEEVIEAQKSVAPHNAITFFFYLPGTDPRGVYTGGSAIWAPNGKWEDANRVRTGNYSQHQLWVTAESVIKSTPTPWSTGIPEQVRRQIYYDLVVAQDSGIGTDESYTVIARKYAISEVALDKIVLEGTLQSWPIPPPPR